MIGWPPAPKALRILAAIVAAIAIFWLGYGTGRVQNIADLSQRYRDTDVARYSLTRAGTLVHFERMGGAGKPYIRAADGFELLDLSDWDHNSRITVDGTSYDLVRLYPTSSVDYERYRLAETLQGSGWLLEREVSLDAAGAVHIATTFVARRPIHHVDLSVAYVHAYLSNAQVGAQRVSARLSRQTSGESPAPLAYQLQVSATGGEQFRPGDASPLGLTSFIAGMSANEPAIDQRTTLGEETIQARPIN